MDGEGHWKEIEKGQEEDYFLRKHREWLEKKRSVKGEDQAGESKGSLLCPRCRRGLHETSQQQWVILECPECGGGWLD
ncbi:MAG: zf-TFIIB domain-containing protein, partial [bacterium]|nr:zf-TFIIB domain-containing protein [bacterium]